MKTKLQISVKCLFSWHEHITRQLRLCFDMHENCERAWNRRSIRWQEALSELISDCHLLWWNNGFLWVVLTTCVCKRQGKLTPALLSLRYARRGIDRGSGGCMGEGGVTHTPVNVMIDSCHMSCVPALRGHQWVRLTANRGQQRASELTRPSEVGQRTCNLTKSHSTLPHHLR